MKILEYFLMKNFGKTDNLSNIIFTLHKALANSVLDSTTLLYTAVAPRLHTVTK